MAKTHKLTAEIRQRTGSGALNAMRREGFIPSVVYGKTDENKNVKVNAKQFNDMLKEAPSSNILVDLDVEGTQQLAFIQDLQHNALTDAVLHADFLAVSEDSVITARLPMVLEGEPVGVKIGGLLEQTIYSLQVTCAAKNLPEVIKADVTPLEVGEALKVGDIQFPEGVSPVLPEGVLIAVVAKTRAAISADSSGEEQEAATPAT